MLGFTAANFQGSAGGTSSFPRIDILGDLRGAMKAIFRSIQTQGERHRGTIAADLSTRGEVVDGTGRGIFGSHLDSEIPIMIGQSGSDSNGGYQYQQNRPSIDYNTVPMIMHQPVSSNEGYFYPRGQPSITYQSIPRTVYQTVPTNDGHNYPSNRDSNNNNYNNARSNVNIATGVSTYDSGNNYAPSDNSANSNFNNGQSVNINHETTSIVNTASDNTNYSVNSDTNNEVDGLNNRDSVEFSEVPSVASGPDSSSGKTNFDLGGILQ